ncbi:MAG: 23S rRNA (guanosine(2251)-2'-O)-methyltransferase RlmB [Thermoleophilaceae bacterium]|nr:23S rRNA (guanosine(2251)-2'-O)-methyltransferase RlmB [Thermoleophilaceae bacterium]
MTEVLYGRNPVREALRAGRRRVRHVWATESAVPEFDAGAVVADAEIERLCGSPDHQGVCAEVDPYPYAEPGSLLAAEDALVVCLDQVQDPRNLGAVCRVAECAGAAGVVIPDRRAAAVTPVAAKAAAGAVEHLAVARVGNLADWILGEAKGAGAWVYGAAAGARTGWSEPDYRGRVVLVLGSEGKGVRPRVAEACDERIALPMRGRIDSLNVSAAAAALVYGVLQFRAQP